MEKLKTQILDNTFISLCIGDIEDLFSFYIKNNIKSYVIDYDGRSIDPNPSWQRNLIRQLNKHQILVESFLYSINLNQGKFKKSAKEILAKSS